MKKGTARLTLLLITSFMTAQWAQAAPASSLDTLAAKYGAASYREWVDFLSLPNDSTVPADIQKNATWLEKAFQKRGFQTRQLGNDGKPIVFAELPGASPDKKTVLFYMHVDGQSVTPSEWHQKSPWQATLKQKNAAGQWEEMPLEKLYGTDVNPDWRLFARSASDDKGPIMMFLAAMDALRATGQQPANNIKVIIDSQEEKNSPSLDGIIRQNLSLLKCDALLVFDGPMHETNRPTLVFGNRGLVAATLKVYGGNQGLHSGHYGNYAPNPVQRMARLLASMKDDDGRVTIPGYYQGIKFDAASKKIMAAVPDNEAALKKRLGIAKADKVGHSYQESLQYPSLNVRGIAAGDVGPKARTIIPAVAVAEIDIRTVPETPPARLFSLLKKHIEKQGYHLVDGQPTAADRAKYDKLASLGFEKDSAQGTALRTDASSPIGQWLHRVFVNTYGAEPVRIRMMGGTVPTGAAVAALKVPFALVPLVNNDNNQHASDENLRLGNYISGVKGMLGILEAKY